ncbi:MAG: thermostable hemolysin [Thauera phenolivorans]|uniref:Thermostable hemolysin n=1 Tax=Thauera phenolivorans TaxID=1792543 RepID=A0A7X7LV29_9RHOO|nr:thermostable hemolysin [Thauera phenolivorans]
MNAEWLAPGAAIAPRAVAPPCALALRAPARPERRSALEDFIRTRFAEHYGARVRNFMPELLGLEADDGELHGALGCRRAGDQPLFLEHYLDLPIEDALAQRYRCAVDRADIVEVGNFAARGPGAGRRLIVGLTEHLAALGLRWVVFTGTRALLNSFRRLGLELQPLAAADPARLGDQAGGWGSYYDSGPMVMACEVEDCHRRLVQSGRCLPPAPAPAPELRHVA